jgi:hypothetical protein
MQVLAFATPSRPDWRWRIVDYAGAVIEESSDSYPTIAAAVARGADRLAELNIQDVSVRPYTYRSTSHLRNR